METVSSSSDLPLSPEPIDPNVIAGLRDLDDGGGGLLGELIDLFFADTPPRLVAVRQAHGAGDAQGLVRAAHALKSSAANLGAQNMATLCQRLESLGRAGDLGGAGPLVDRLDAEFQGVRALLPSSSHAPCPHYSPHP